MFDVCTRRPPAIAVHRHLRAMGGAGVAVLVALAVMVPAAAAGAPRCPWVSSRQPIAQRVADVLRHMSLADEIDLVEGHGTAPPNPYVFYMPGIPQLCIPQLGEEDGPAGVADQQTGVTQLPAGVAVAATWDPALADAYGQVIGSEEGGKGAAVNLGPTVNIDRDPRWGRSFETFSEDPLLTSTMAVAEIDGVQSRRVMSQVKHFDVYNQETNRNLPPDDAIVSQRAMHEIYMPAFEAAIDDAGVASVMCAYSFVNGSDSCDNSDLLTSVLRQQWGFGGFVTSDYGAVHSTAAAADGTDQEQPESTYFGTPLQQAISQGTISRAVLNTMVSRILGQMFRFNLIAAPLTGTTSDVVTTPAHQAVGTEVAATGATLLKNAGGVLPLPATSAGNVAVIGPAASAAPTDGGGGSAYVLPSGTVTPLQGIEAAAGSGTHVSYTQGLPADDQLTPIPASALTPAYAPTPAGGSYTGTLTAPETGTYVLAISDTCQCYAPTYLYLDAQEIIDNAATPPNSVFSAAVQLVAGQHYTLAIKAGTGSGGNAGGQSNGLTWATPSQLAPGLQQAAAAASTASTAVVVVSDDTESEDADRPGLSLPSAQDELVETVAAANPHTVVVIDAGAPVAMPWLASVASVLDAWYPGQTNGASLAQVLFGQVDPSGHLPVTFPAALAQVPAASPQQFPGENNEVVYSEGIHVGYRWYDAKRLTPLFPFGYGLSYTQFRFSRLRVTSSSADGLSPVLVTATVRNVGTRAGADVAELYLGDPRPAGEPPRQLVAFQRVSLAPGHSARVTFLVEPRATWWWDQRAGGWSQSTGRYTVYVGDSSALANLPLRGSFVIHTTAGARQVSVQAPRSMNPRKPARVTVRLGAAGTAVLPRVRLALQAPQGFTVTSVGGSEFTDIGRHQPVTATFDVTPPPWAPAENVTLHATATMGSVAQREAGVTATVS